MVTLSSCSGNDGINELSSETEGLKLLCNNSKTKFIAEIRIIKLTNITDYLWISNWYGWMDKPNLVIFKC